MQRFLQKILLLTLFTMALFTTQVFASAGSDYQGHWAEKDIRAMVSQGVLKGNQNGDIMPDNNITRAEAVTIVNRALGIDKTGTATFSDVKQADWFWADVSKALAQGYIKGYNDNTFKPNNMITREEGAVILANTLKNTTVSAISFSDANSIASWAIDSVSYLCSKKIISGYNDGTFRPKANVTRAEFVKMVSILCSTNANAEASVGTGGVSSSGISGGSGSSSSTSSGGGGATTGGSSSTGGAGATTGGITDSGATTGGITDSGATTGESISTPATIYTVTYAYNYDTAGTYTIQTITSGSVTTAPTAPTRTGYTFTGWYTGSDLATAYIFGSAVAGNMTLYAKWTAVETAPVVTKYAVTFNYNYPGANAPYLTQLVTCGSTISLPSTNPRWAFHTFSGWYKEAACTNSFGFGTYTITADTSLYAKWGDLVETPETSFYWSGNTITRYIGKETSVVVPSRCTAMSEYVFHDSGSGVHVVSVTIPSSVISISDTVFDWCDKLASIDVYESNTAYMSENGILFNKARTALLQYPAAKTGDSYMIPESVTNISDGAFYYCTSLTSIFVPSGITSIGDNVFCDCINLTSISLPSGITSIGDRAFRYCSNLSTFNISPQITSIGEEAFANCRMLTSIDVDSVNANYVSDNGVLFNKSRTTLLQYPAGKTGSSYTIPASVTTIAKSSFAGSAGLNSIIIPQGVTTIGDSAFSFCSGLTSIIIPEGVNNIQAFTFNYCYNLTSISLPSSVKNIGFHAFAYCDKLTSITIPAAVTYISTESFRGCESLTSLSVDPNNTYYIAENGLLFNKNKTSLILYPCAKTDSSYTIPSSVTSIEDNAFEDCTKLSTIIMPTGVTNIGYNAFAGCTNLTGITLSAGLKSIETGAFARCYGLTTITIPASVTNIGYYPFQDCTSLTSIVVNLGNTTYMSENGVLLNKNQTSLIQYPAGKTDSVYAVPPSVIKIDYCAFMDCNNLASITIPSSVTSIESSAFSACNGLMSITIPSSVTSIGQYAFSGCSSLSSITISSGVTSIRNGTFYGCSSLTSITIPSSVTSVWGDVFSNCNRLISITVLGKTQAQAEALLANVTLPSGCTITVQ